MAVLPPVKLLSFSFCKSKQSERTWKHFRYEINTFIQAAMMQCIVSDYPSYGMNCTHQDQIWAKSVLGEGAECDWEGREGRRRAKRARWGKEEKPRFILGHNLQGSSEILSPFINSSWGKAVLTKHRTESGGKKDVHAQEQKWLIRQLLVCSFVLLLLYQYCFNMKLESCEMYLFLWSFF